MPWNLNSDKPVYLQLMELIERNILSGTYATGERLPSVRELATLASVNPNTMQKALQELERKGLVYAERTTGRYITTDTTLISHMRHELGLEETNRYFEAMATLGFTSEEIKQFLTNYKEGAK